MFIGEQKKIMKNCLYTRWLTPRYSKYRQRNRLTIFYFIPFWRMNANQSKLGTYGDSLINMFQIPNKLEVQRVTYEVFRQIIADTLSKSNKEKRKQENR